MITKNTLFTLGAAALLTASLSLAQTKKETASAAPAKAATAAKAATTHVMNGTVQSVSGSGATMSVVVKGTKDTDKPVTLMLNASTTKKGDLVSGAKVNAHYREENGQNIATSITASAAAKTAAAAKPSTKAPASTTAPAAKK